MLSWVVSALERPLVMKDAPREADAIVVLGGLLGPGDGLSTVLAERVDAAVGLWQTGLAPIVIATGGVTSGTRPEADVIAEALEARGVTGVIVERASRSTSENARFTAALVGPDVRVVWLVTQPFHGRRAARLFRRAGFEPLVWHIEDSIQYRERRRAMKWVVREYAAWGRALLHPKR